MFDSNNFQICMTQTKKRKKEIVPIVFIFLLLLFLSLSVLPLSGSEIFETLPNTTDNQELFLTAPQTKTAVLLLHGLTASPWELKELATYLRAQNLTVLVPVIAGHSTSLRNLEQSNWEDWFDSASRAYNTLTKQYDNIFILGVSNGAMLAIDISAEKTIKPRGIISIAAPFKFKDPLGELTLIGKYFQRYANHSVIGGEIGHYYKLVPTRSISEIILMRKSVNKHLSKIQMPILIIQSENDPTTNPDSAQYLYNNIASEQKSIILRQEAEHILVSKKKPDLYKDIFEFIKLNS